MSTIKDVLVDARAILAAGNWYQGSFTDGCGKFCALGAVAKAVGYTPKPEKKDEHGFLLEIGSVDNGGYIAFDPRHVPFDLAVVALEQVVPNDEGQDGIAAYNDQPGRKLDEILALFDRAIALAAADGGTP